ncbi:MAG: hypothetical protein M0R77_06630 [Gammaproteobacteria bacterium]|nr:hypothetical protein [Gammaproteobacteria bacterium]
MNAKLVLALVLSFAAMSACSTREVVSGAAGGAGGYELANKRAMDQLKDDYAAGRITQDEYERRKEEIESRSAVY